MRRDLYRALLLNMALTVGAVTRGGQGRPVWHSPPLGPSGQPRPWIIAHRGASLECLENTLTAFRLAKTQGADAIELDIRRCRSGELVVFHDADLSRLAGEPVRIDACDLQRLQSHRLSGGERIPTLDQVLTAPDVPLRINIEIKAESRRNDGLEAELVRLVRTHNALHRVIVSSFNPVVLARLARLEPSLPRGFLYHPETPRRWLRRPWCAPFIRPQLLHPFHPLVTREVMLTAHSLGYQVIPWTVDDPAEWSRLMDLEVDGIITNRPDALCRHLGIG